MTELKTIFALALFAVSLVITSFGQDQRTKSFGDVEWSRDGKWIAFTQMNVAKGPPMQMDADIWVVKPDGSGLRRVTGDGKNEFNPSFSHDEKTLFFNINDQVADRGDLYSIGVDGSGLKQLTTEYHHASAPQVSPDGKWILFNANLTADPKDHHRQIFVMKADGSGIKQLSNDGSVGFFNPVWSPDGKRIVYYIERGDQKDQIWSMNADGSDAKLLTANVGHNFYPSWSANGKQILFTSQRDGKRQLYSMNADGSDVRTLGIYGFYIKQSPDGKKIVYISGEFPVMTIYIANADGSNARKLVS